MVSPGFTVNAPSIVPEIVSGATEHAAVGVGVVVAVAVGVADVVGVPAGVADAVAVRVADGVPGSVASMPTLPPE
jgi:ABC-type proline/glycine betaine transport system permease subunit